MYPLKLSYFTKSPIWSGNELATNWGYISQNGDNRIGEAWVLSVRHNDNCIIENGEYAGKALSEVLGCTDFPLLVKLIDAGDKLSVQIHPDDAYLRTHETNETHGKTEMWYILDAKPGAELIYGLADGVSCNEFAKAVADGNVLPMLKSVKVSAGDVYFIPAGLVHAIGKGILLAEVQQNCDLTYRVYDYDRLGKDGKPRELHKAQAVEVARCFEQSEIDGIRFSNGRENDGVIADCEYFRVTVESGETELGSVSDNRFIFVLCIEGEGIIKSDGREYTIGKGDGYFITDTDNAAVYGNLRIVTASSQMNIERGRK